MYIKINSNRKLGNMGSFSLPSVETCPLATTSCLKVCYTKKGFFCFSKMKNMLKDNLKFTKSKNFVSTISREIRNNNISLVRIHVAGDFYSPKYVEKWYQIAQRNKNTKFFSYTRSWVEYNFWNAFYKLGNLTNVVLLASLDKDNQAEICPSFFRKTYMSFGETPKKDVDIVFRVNRKSKQKYLGKYRICPKETGNETKANKALTCGVCKLCFV